MKRMKRVLQRRASGVSLIEVLVAILVLSIGLLGVAALMGNALQFNQGAQARTQAVLLASDIVERARVNRTDRAAYALDDEGDCAAAIVGASVAARDVAEWLRQVGCALPGGEAQIVFAGDQMTVTLQWADTTNDNTETLVVTAQLQ
ncbi:type IV pilus modification protein PilV [Salinispirillum marinum]|uniref:Type IV pilus modification protein PilV n=2 Tax=Saccharospirillaceae TaxID=255527 RepID=A0ABV8BK60_9GAMM